MLSGRQFGPEQTQQEPAIELTEQDPVSAGALHGPTRK
jgi:hypothetical protein